MNHKGILIALVLIISLLGILASATGVFSTDDKSAYEYQSIRGKTVLIYGKGIYKDMSDEVAPQGIAQDYVTLFLAVPFLLISLIFSLKGSIRWRMFHTGVLAYFLVTYLFYLTMGMYNSLYIVYVLLLSTSFFAFIINLFSFNPDVYASKFKSKLPHRLLGSFLLFASINIAFLWLSIIIKPLMDGSIIPESVEHYTTLIVQGLDLALLLPMGFISGLMLIRKKALGYIFSHVYFVFLSFLMTALVAKIIAMGMRGSNIIPVIFIIPVFDIFSICCAVTMFKNYKES